MTAADAKVKAEQNQITILEKRIDAAIERGVKCVVMGALTATQMAYLKENGYRIQKSPLLSRLIFGASLLYICWD